MSARVGDFSRNMNATMSSNNGGGSKKRVVGPLPID